MISLHDLHDIISRAVFPASKDELITFVKKEGYPREAVQRLETLPEYMYGSADSVMDALRNLE